MTCFGFDLFKALLGSTPFLLCVNGLSNDAICRNSRPEVFCKKVVLRNFVKLTGKHLCQSLFFNKGLSLQLYLSHASVSVILLSMQVIITSTQCVIGLLICGNSSSWLPNLNLIYETPQSGEGSGLLSTKLRKLNTEAAFQRCSFKKVF